MEPVCFFEAPIIFLNQDSGARPYPRLTAPAFACESLAEKTPRVVIVSDFAIRICTTNMYKVGISNNGKFPIFLREISHRQSQ